MIFKNTLPNIQFPFRIKHNELILSIGSCFTEHIGNKLSNLKFLIAQNPFGIVYNPMSISSQLKYIFHSKIFKSEDLSFNNGKFFTWNHHSSFSNKDESKTLEKINLPLLEIYESFEKLTHLHITFATAWIYEIKDETQIVANCHKFPHEVFQKRILSIDEILNTFEPVLNHFISQFPNIKLLFSLSPVRHIRDGIIEDRLSKSILHVSIHEIVKQYSQAYYFPAYELVNDDLRDYRFYKQDLVHPNDMAIEYVWEYFCNSFFDNNTLEINKKIDAILKMKNHIGDENNIEYLQFKQKIEFLENQFNLSYPHIIL